MKIASTIEVYFHYQQHLGQEQEDSGHSTKISLRSSSAPLWDSQLRVQSNKMFPNRGIYYRFERNESLLLRASDLIRSAKGFDHGLDFEADWLVIVTFNEIGTTAHIGTLYQHISSNTYQMILAGDDKMTFTIFLYPADAMQWWDIRSVAGFNAGSLNYSYRLGPDKDCGSIGSELPEHSYSCAVLGSNTGVQGLWILSSTLGKHFCLTFWKNLVEKNNLSYLWNRLKLINCKELTPKTIGKDTKIVRKDVWAVGHCWDWNQLWSTNLQNIFECFAKGWLTGARQLIYSQYRKIL